jgi:hypothetical protein
MGNHFHLVVKTPQPNLVVTIKVLVGTYIGRSNFGLAPAKLGNQSINGIMARDEP